MADVNWPRLEDIATPKKAIQSAGCRIDEKSCVLNRTNRIISRQ
jgi:hypothetical protein